MRKGSMMVQPPRVLIADTEAGVRQSLCMLLQHAGYEVTTAACGAEAIELLKQASYDLLLVDLSMPLADGAQVIDAARDLRGEGLRGRSRAEQVMVVGAFRLDIWRQIAILHGRTLPLTPTEFRVLLCLAENAGVMQTYAQLVKYAQGYQATDAEACELIKTHIRHLRQKLEPDPSAPRYILNVRGKGYLLAPEGQ